MRGGRDPGEGWSGVEVAPDAMEALNTPRRVRPRGDRRAGAFVSIEDWAACGSKAATTSSLQADSLASHLPP